MSDIERGFCLGVIWLAVIQASLGCAANVSLGGSNGLHVGAALMGASGVDGATSRGVASTWGHGKISAGTKTVYSDRKGVSANLRGVLGDGLGIVIADKALCAIPAVAPSCLADRFIGNSDMSRADAEALLAAETD